MCLPRFFGSLLNEETKKGINLEEFEREIIPTCTLMEAQAQTDLILENTEAQQFYFLYHGNVKVTKKVDGDVEDEPEAEATDNSRSPKSMAAAALTAAGGAAAAAAGAGEIGKKKVKKKKSIELGMLGAGNYFGEISILTSTPCRATLRTETNCLLLRVVSGVLLLAPARPPTCPSPDQRARICSKKSHIFTCTHTCTHRPKRRLWTPGVKFQVFGRSSWCASWARHGE